MINQISRKDQNLMWQSTKCDTYGLISTQGFLIFWSILWCLMGDSIYKFIYKCNSAHDTYSFMFIFHSSAQ